MPDEPDDTQKRLIEEILADADRKAERVLKRAHAEAERLNQEAIGEVARQAEAIENNAVAQGEALLERAMNGLPLDLRIHDLSVRDRYVEQAFERAIATFAAADAAARREGITRLAVEAVATIAAIGEAEVHVQLGPQDARWADEAWLGEVVAAVAKTAGRAPAVKMASPSAAAHDGVLAACSDGRVRMNNTLTARLARSRDRLREEVAELLFADIPEQGPAERNTV